MVSYRESGDGFEILDSNGQVIAWTLDQQWTFRILAALELLEAGEDNGADRKGTSVATGRKLVRYPMVTLTSEMLADVEDEAD